MASRFPSRRAQTPGPYGRWLTPILLGILDDRSRLVCHAQWYLDETVESLVHGVCQALQKRGLPRALMSDNGAAMLAGEFTEGLAHPRVAALREFITDWYVSYLAIDQTRSQSEAGPHERLSKGGENLPNVIQYLKSSTPNVWSTFSRS